MKVQPMATLKTGCKTCSSSSSGISAVLQYHNGKLSQCQCYNITISHGHRITISKYHRNSVTISLIHNITILQYYIATISQQQCHTATTSGTGTQAKHRLCCPNSHRERCPVYSWYTALLNTEGTWLNLSSQSHSYSSPVLHSVSPQQCSVWVWVDLTACGGRGGGDITHTHTNSPWSFNTLSQLTDSTCLPGTVPGKAIGNTQ